MNKTDEQVSEGLLLADESENKTTVKIKPGHKKEDPVTLEISQGIARGVTIADSGGRTHGPHKPIKMKLTASRKDIERLAVLCREYPKEWADDLDVFVFTPACHKLIHPNYNRDSQLGSMRRDAAFLYSLFSRICAGPEVEMPGYFVKLQRKMTHSDNPKGNNQWSTKTLRNAAAYTAFSIESYYGEGRFRRLKIKLPSEQSKYSFKSFYTNYISPELSWADKYFTDKEKHIQLSILKVNYMKKKTDKKAIHPQLFGYHKQLASRTDMTPCDKQGRELNVVLNGKQMEKVKALLYREIITEEPFNSIFSALKLL